MELTKKQLKEIRKIAGATGKPWQIEIVDGEESPHVAGDSCHYETKGGRRIHHPSAYSKSGWSNMVYVHSSRRVEVGVFWLVQHGYIPYSPSFDCRPNEMIAEDCYA